MAIRTWILCFQIRDVDALKCLYSPAWNRGWLTVYVGRYYFQSLAEVLVELESRPHLGRNRTWIEASPLPAEQYDNAGELPF